MWIMTQIMWLLKIGLFVDCTSTSWGSVRSTSIFSEARSGLQDGSVIVMRRWEKWEGTGISRKGHIGTHRIFSRASLSRHPTPRPASLHPFAFVSREDGPKGKGLSEFAWDQFLEGDVRCPCCLFIVLALLIHVNHVNSFWFIELK